MKLFLSCPRHTEDLLREELDRLSVPVDKQVPSGVYVPFSPGNVYRICLYTHIANRLLLQFPSCNAESPEILREEIRKIPWEDHIRSGTGFIVDCSETNNIFRSSLFACQIAKDGILARYDDIGSGRPFISTGNPELHVNLFLYGNRAIAGIDLSGGSLHERGYRIKSVSAPIRENTAAAALYRAGWAEGRYHQLFDPMCGSGTFLVEAAMIASGFPANYLRSSFGFEKWPGHDAFCYRSARQDAEELSRKALRTAQKLVGMD
ncbi:MAG: hypothetical protein JW874_13410, partial [Spirochaetales bacterium]|nr:hypothetical protein [Spirochaetales bacterium]